jgi:uncharacterized metal-binding protein YceD (DUF177 family)
VTWKLPLNQIGNGCTFIVGPYQETPKFKATTLALSQHLWLQDILSDLNCTLEGDAANFALAVDVEKQSATYRVTAHLRMVPRLECVRSLTQFRTAIETENEALYVLAAPKTGNSGEHELSESELESYEHDGQSLILSEFVTDVVFTSLPDFPLCQADCRGLCHECGCNLNETRECGKSKAMNEGDFVCPHIHEFQ